MTREHDRLDETDEQKLPWKKWGPYLSERQWGTVREDYSEGGDAWNYFTHDQARSRAYRWGEDGLAGISDDHQRLCFALALWNGRDPILKERPFGLTNSESNHGEDVKEYYFYLGQHSDPLVHDAALQVSATGPIPYADLVENNRHRGRHESEYELLDTGIFDEDRYFDVFVEYAKESPGGLDPDSASTTEEPRPGQLRCTSCRPCGSATSGPGESATPRPRSSAARSARLLRRAASIKAVDEPSLGARAYL